MSDERSEGNPLATWVLFADAATQLKVSPRTLERMVQEGKLAKIKHAGKLWIPAGEIQDYIKRQEAEGAKTRAVRAKVSRAIMRTQAGA
ncbi:MAG: helix-turn-helix domain-containing protein [Sciscionella sp.]